jgi:hypothetical protein
MEEIVRQVGYLSELVLFVYCKTGRYKAESIITAQWLIKLPF